MQFKTFPTEQGIQPDELNSLLLNGWICLGVLPITTKRSGIATVSDPGGGAPHPTLVFTRMQPMLPASIIMQILVMLSRRTMTVEQAAQKLFNARIIDIEREIYANAGAPLENSGSGDQEGSQGLVPEVPK